jgi:hypothetical protein
MTTQRTAADGLDGLGPDSFARLDWFARAIDRVHVDDLALYAARPRQPAHRRAVEAAAVAARSAGLEAAIDDARRAVTDDILREFASAQLRLTVAGQNSALAMGPADERVAVMRSLGDAIAAIVLWDRLDEADRAELLGLWARLLP